MDQYRKMEGPQVFSSQDYMFTLSGMFLNQACFSGTITGNKEVGWCHWGEQHEGTAQLVGGAEGHWKLLQSQGQWDTEARVSFNPPRCKWPYYVWPDEKCNSLGQNGLSWHLQPVTTVLPVPQQVDYVSVCSGSSFSEWVTQWTTYQRRDPEHPASMCQVWAESKDESTTQRMFPGWLLSSTCGTAEQASFNCSGFQLPHLSRSLPAVKSCHTIIITTA